MHEFNAIDERGAFFTRLPHVEHGLVSVIEVSRGQEQRRGLDEAWRFWIDGGIVETPRVKPFRSWKAVCGVPTWSVEATT